MQCRSLGKTGLNVSVIGFSGRTIPKIPAPEARILLAGALASGINFFDTASAYGDSEPRIGEAIQDQREGVVLSAKSASLTAREARTDVLRACQRLRVGRIDLFQVGGVNKMRRLEAVLEPDGLVEGLLAERTAGRVGHIGVAGYNCVVLREALERCDAFETVQFPFNILEDGEPERALLAAAHERGVGTVVVKPLAGGLLPEPLKALRWVLTQPVGAAVVGMVSADEITANATVADHPEPLTPPEEADLRERVAHLAEHLCRRCMACEPCPQGIPIYEILELGRRATLPQMADLAREIYEGLEMHADACAECGECEERCQYGLPVISMLKDAHDRLSE